jgi:predicted phage terminase large subunit-like protein
MHHDLGTNSFRRLATSRAVHQVIIGPRGSAKSTHGAEGWVLYSICEGLENYIIICSDSSDQAEKHVDVIKEELANNEFIKKKYPNVAGIGPVWKNNAIVTRNGIRLEALGAGKKIRGRRFKKHRPTLIVVDDPEGDDAAYSEVLREHRRSWYLKGVLKAGSPTTNHLVIGSNIHMECLVSHLTKTPGFQVFKYQSIIKWPLNMNLWDKWEQILLDNPDDPTVARQFYLDNKDEMDEGAEVLWPEYEDLYSLMVTRAVGGHYAFEAEKQNNPIDPSKCEWDPSLFPDVMQKNDPRWFHAWPEDVSPAMSVQVMDPSKKGKSDKPTDFGCILNIKVYGGHFYVDCDMKRMTTGGCKELWMKRAIAHKPQFSGIESVMFSELFVQDLFKPMHDAGITPPIAIDQQGIDKHTRIRRLDPYLRSSKIKWMYRSSGVKELISQCQLFPNGDHDDGPDALEMGFRLLQMINNVKWKNAQTGQTENSA